MNKIKLNEIDLEKSFFHFTNALNIKLINEYGLLPTIGENSKGPENTEKVFFAQGTDGVLKICDMWIKWLMNRMNNYHSLSTQYEGQELVEMANKWDTEFLSREYLKDEVKKIKTFEKMFTDMKGRKYLILDIKDGIDFSYDDIDEAKEYCIESKRKNPESKDYKYMKEFYGRYSNIEVPTVEKWNMHTYTGRSILPSQILQLTTEDGRESALSILLEVYDKYKSIDVKFDILDEFIAYSKEKVKQEEKNYFGSEDLSFHTEKVSELLRRNGFESLIVKLCEETLAEQDKTTDKDTVGHEMQKQEIEINCNEKKDGLATRGGV